MAELTVRRILPPLLRAKGFEEAARRCEEAGTTDAADAAYAAADDADRYLVLSAEIALQALREQNAPGVALWDQLQAEEIAI